MTDCSFPGVTVRLFAAGNPVAVAVDVSDQNGTFGFADLPAGDYSFFFFNDTATTEISPATQGLDTSADSDPDPATGITATFSLALGEGNTTIDAGMLETLVFIGDFESGDTSDWNATVP